MTEVTRVPLQPIAKGSLVKLWLGVAFAAAAAGSLAWATMPAMVSVKTLVAGDGPSPTMTDVAMVKLKGELKDGTVFQPEAQGALPVSGMIPGFTKALLQMQKGGKYQVIIPAVLGYGDKPAGQAGEIPANSDLYFDVELVDFMTQEQMQQRQAMMEQMRQMQQQQGKGAPGGRMPGGPPPMPGGEAPPQ